MLVCSAAEQAMFVMALRDFVHCLMLSESPQAKLARTRLPEDAEGRTTPDSATGFRLLSQGLSLLL